MVCASVGRQCAYKDGVMVVYEHRKPMGVRIAWWCVRAYTTVGSRWAIFIVIPAYKGSRKYLPLLVYTLFVLFGMCLDLVVCCHLDSG